MQVKQMEMSNEISQICEKIEKLNAELDLKRAQMAEKSIGNSKDILVPLELELQSEHRKSKTNIFAYVVSLPISHHISVPFVYAMIIPFSIMDLFVVIYQAICFRLWSINLVNRSMHVVVDRHHLQYLNGLEKLNCIYCGYANGVVSFTSEVAARTERYWCPIKHAKNIPAPHSKYIEYTEFGDVDAWKFERKYPKK